MPLYDVIVIGGGIAGLAAAAALRRRGIASVLILERATALRPVGAAIGLFPNGLAALEQISPSALGRVLSSSIPIEKNVVRDADGGAVLSERTVAPSSSAKHPNPVFLVWYLLQRYLREEVPEDSLWLGATASKFFEEEDCAVVEGSRAGKAFSVRARVVVGADGIRSVVRRSLWGERALNYHGQMMLRSCVNMSALDDGICPSPGVQVRFIDSEQGKLFGVRETSPGIATVTATVKFAEPVFASDADARKARMRDLFSEYPSTVRHVIERTPAHSFLEHAIVDIEVMDEWAKGRFILIGDAAHAMTPTLGQGANLGMEDAAELAHVLAPFLRNEKAEIDELCGGLLAFEEARRERVCPIHAASREATMAHNSRTKEGGPSEAEKQKEELFLQKLYQWTPSREPALAGV